MLKAVVAAPQEEGVDVETEAERALEAAKKIEEEAKKRAKAEEKAKAEAEAQEEEARRKAEEKAKAKAKAEEEKKKKAKTKSRAKEKEDLQILRYNRALKKESMESERKTLESKKITKTPASIQLSLVDKLMQDLDRIHRRI